MWGEFSLSITRIFHGTAQARSGTQGSAEPVRILSRLHRLTDVNTPTLMHTSFSSTTFCPQTHFYWAWFSPGFGNCWKRSSPKSSFQTFKSICFQAGTMLKVLAIPRTVEPTYFLVGKPASVLSAEGILWNTFRKQMIDSPLSVV